MKLSILIFALFISSSVYAQLYVYSPDGNFIFKSASDSLSVIYDSLHIDADTRSVVMNEGCFIVFNFLTGKRLAIISVEKFTNKVVTSSIIKWYDKQIPTYFFSATYLKGFYSLFEKRVLTPKYLVSTFGQPDNKEMDSGKEVWSFNTHNIRAHISGATINLLELINFDSVQKYMLGVSLSLNTENKYSIGFGCKLENHSTKTIKYAYITVAAKNPVHDIIATKTFTAVGPITPNSSSTFDFDNAFYSKTASFVDWVKLKIQYFDGTVKTLSKKEIANISIWPVLNAYSD